MGQHQAWQIYVLTNKMSIPSMLPSEFNGQGVLPHDYEVTFTEIRNSILVRRHDPLPPGWNAEWRGILVDNLEILVRQLWAAGVTTIYINGSFVQNKPHPGDIDGCFEGDFADWNSGDLEKRLNSAAPKKVWDWSLASKRQVFGESRLLMWVSYRVELYPVVPEFPTSGVDTDDGFVPFPDGYRLIKNRSHETKGILKLIKDPKEAV
jgi:hypothetical protein